MLYLILLFQIVGFSILGYFVYNLWKKFNSAIIVLQSVVTSLNKVHARIDKIFTIDAPEPNQATETNKNEVDLGETDFQVPKDVKLDIEGGDSQTPPGFEEKK